MMKQAGINLKPEAMETSGRELMKHVMQAWLPAGDALMKMMIVNLPSPAVAQAYRVDCLYDGPVDDRYATAIKTCDADGPLIVYVAKLVPAGDQAGRFYALGRVFSGKVTPGAKVRIRSSEDGSVFFKSVHRTGLWMVKAFEPVDGVPCGNTVALSGLDGVITKTATINGDKDLGAHGFKAMNFPVAAIVRVSVASSDVKRLKKALELLAKSDPLVQCVFNKSGEHIIAGVGELHLQACINDLKKYMSAADLVVGTPVVRYRETVVSKSSRSAMTKSHNKHNKLSMVASPLEEELVRAITDNRVGPGDATTLHEEFGLERGAAKNVWCFSGSNMLVNSTKGAVYIKEARESVVTGFTEACLGGALAGEPLHGVRVDLTDAVFHSDAIHRGAGQVTPSATSGVRAAQLAASPRLMEPFYFVEVTMPEDAVGAVLKAVHFRRGQVLEQPSGGAGGMAVVMAELPVAESFGFIDELQLKTSGEAVAQMKFNGWRVMDSDPLQKGSPAALVVASIRARKGLPALSD